MAKRNKLSKFSDLRSYDHVYQCYDPVNSVLEKSQGEEIDMAGQWNSFQFKNDNPIILELACGRGEYTLGLAAMYPNKNFIGVDVKGARIWKGATYALENKIENVAFLRTRIEQIDQFFAAGEVAEIWITFPDPFERKSKANRRLTNHNFLKRYRHILKPEGLVHLKTDADSLWEHTLEVIAEDPKIEVLYQNDNIYSRDLDFKELEIKTTYEKSHLEDGRIIKYIQYKL